MHYLIKGNQRNMRTNETFYKNKNLVRQTERWKAFEHKHKLNMLRKKK